MRYVDIIGGSLCILWGLCSIIWHKRFGSGAVRAQYKLLNVRFDERAFQLAYLIAGIAFVLIGVTVVLYTVTR